MKKGIIIGIIVVVLLVLFLPIPKGTYEDGGTRDYCALTYRIVVWNKLIAEVNEDGSAGEVHTYRKTSVFWIPENYKSIDELWIIENGRNWQIGICRDVADSAFVLSNRREDMMMMIIKNDIPILEYDDSSPEVISPDHGWSAGKFPEKCLFAFLGDVVHEYANKHNAKVAETLITVSHDIKIYILHETEEDICLLQSPIGAAASSQVLDTLVSCGCRKVIAVGSCGVLADLPEDAFIVPTKALRAEGTSYHYLPASRYIELDKEPISVIEETFKKHGLPFVTCMTWSTDGFFRETKDMVQYRLEEGCSVVEMECAALAACCRKRRAQFGQFLFTADSLANVHEYDAREFGAKSHEKALFLGLDILRNYREK